MIPAEDKLRFDLYYIRNYSLLLDLQTIPVVLTPSAARGRNDASNLGHHGIAFLTNPRSEYEQQLLDKRAP